MKKYLFTFLLLTGCATQMPQQTLSINDPQWQQHLSQLQQLTTYKTVGQLGVISEKQRFSTSFNWQYQNEDKFHLHLSAFLNIASIDLQMTNSGLRLIDDKGQIHYGEEAERLLNQAIGENLSLQDLSQWLKGIPPKGAYQIGENHLLQSFNYQGWQVNYLRYHERDLPLPQDILLKKGNHQLKIRIKEWQW